MFKKMKFAGGMVLAAMALTLMPANPALATVAAGEWRLHPTFAPPPQKLVVTDDSKVFFVAAGRLFCHDSANDETFSFTTENYLNDTAIENIFLNPSEKFVMVCYQSGNIDLIYYGASDGFRTVNLSDIKDAAITSSKRVNGVDFTDGTAYIATDFGLVEYDTRRHEVRQSGIYNTPVAGVAVLGDYVVIYADQYFRSVRRGARINSLDQLSRQNYWGNVLEFRRVNETTVAVRRESSQEGYYFCLLVFIAENGAYQGHYSFPHITQSSQFIDFADGSTGFVNTLTNEVVHITPQLQLETIASLSEGDAGAQVAVGSSGAAVWSLTEEGIEGADYSKGGKTVTTSRFVPETFAVDNVAFIIPDADGSRIGVTDLGCTAYRGYGDGEGYSIGQQTSVFDLVTGEVTDVALRGYYSENQSVAQFQNGDGHDRPLAPERIAFDPVDKSTYYLATANDGVLKISEGKLVGIYDHNNSPMKRTSVGCRVFEVAFDPAGNLWMIHATGADNGAIVMLPAAKTSLDPAKVKPSDWKTVNAPGFSGDKDARILFCRKSPAIVAFDCRSAHGLVVIATNGTYDNFGDDRVSVVTSFTDQDGKAFSLGTERFTSLAEDHDGRVWLGSTYGVIELSSPTAVNGSAATINRLKVPRNDGTNSADYLLGSDRVYDISVDNANRKWLATEVSGLYLVSERGNEIVGHFTAENSPLRSNMINAVYADPLGNSVYVATAEGLYEYGGDATPAMDSYDNLVAYPNPVRPDYSGPVTITGLMEGSLVKISDASGHVVAQLTSEGGMATWDACDRSGNRVKSGVYFVLASSGGGDSGSGTKGGTAKIVVVN